MSRSKLVQAGTSSTNSRLLGQAVVAAAHRAAVRRNWWERGTVSHSSLVQAEVPPPNRRLPCMRWLLRLAEPRSGATGGSAGLCPAATWSRPESLQQTAGCLGRWWLLRLAEPRSGATGGRAGLCPAAASSRQKCLRQTEGCLACDGCCGSQSRGPAQLVGARDCVPQPPGSGRRSPPNRRLPCMRWLLRLTEPRSGATGESAGL